MRRALESADSRFDSSARNSQQETAIPDAYRSDRIFSDRTGEDLTFWLALRRVNRGGVAWLEGRYYDYGRPVPVFMNAPLNELVESAHVALSEAGMNAADIPRVALTNAGRGLYSALGERHG